jgi:hypothetical protein
MKVITLTSLLFFAVSAQAAIAAPGDLDRTYGDHGRIAIAVGTGYAELGGATLDATGRLLLSGHAVDSRGAGLGLVRLSASGASGPPSILHDPGARLTAWVPGATAAFPLAGGGLQTLGSLANGPGGTGIGIVRDDPAGYTQIGTELGWSGAGYHLIAAGMDGVGRTLILTDLIGEHQPTRDPLVTRLGRDGTIDQRYSAKRVAGDLDNEFTVARAMLVRRDGSALVAINPLYAGNRASSLSRVVGLDDHAGLIYGLGTSGNVVLSHTGVKAIIEGPSHTFLVAGNDSRGAWITRLLRDGDVDRHFGRKGTARPTSDRRFAVTAMGRDHHGRIVLAGGYRRASDHVQAAAARLSRLGAHDRRFGLVVKQLGARRGVRFAQSRAAAVATDRRDRILLAGTAWDDATAEAQYGLRGRGYFAVARLKG